MAILAFEDIELLKTTKPHLAVKLIDVLTASTVEKIIELQNQEQPQYIAIIADNSQIKSLVDFAVKNKDFFDKFPIVATSTIASRLLSETGIDSDMIMHSQNLIGRHDAIGSFVVAGNIKAVIYFREPLFLFIKDNLFGVEALSRLCDLRKIPFATNSITAEAVVDYLERNMIHPLYNSEQ